MNIILISKIKVFFKKAFGIILKNKAILILFVLGLLLFFLNMVHQHYKIKKITSTYQQTLLQKETEFSKVVNKLTNEISYQQKVIEHERILTRNLQDVTLKKITEELRIESKNIREYINLKYQSSNKGNTDKVALDTSKGVLNPKYSFEWNDSFLFAKVNVDKNLGEIEYSYFDSVRLVGFVKKTGFLGLGKQQYMMDVKFANQKTNMIGMQSVNFNKVPAPRYSIGIGVGYHYLPMYNKFSPGIGISIQRNLINIR